eukprot:Hpha_TRINITY_DN4019_c0_g1::TRINITY_DN4019_c0_g1_i1::g.63669::m.63669
MRRGGYSVWRAATRAVHPPQPNQLPRALTRVSLPTCSVRYASCFIMSSAVDGSDELAGMSAELLEPQMQVQNAMMTLMARLACPSVTGYPKTDTGDSRTW